MVKWVAIEVKCPKCGGTNVVKNGKNQNGVQRYMCQNKECPLTTFLLDYTYTGCKPGIDGPIIKMAANASGIRDISRILGVSTQKVLETLKNDVNNNQGPSVVCGKYDVHCRSHI